MGRAASRTWRSRARRYWQGDLSDRRHCRQIFGSRLRFWRAVSLAVATIVLVAIARPAAGQTPDVCTGPADATVCTGPITSSMRFEFDAPTNVTTSTFATALEPRVYVDGSTTVFQPLADICTGAAAPFHCTAPVPASFVAVLNVAGLHSVTIKLFDPSTGLEGPSAVPFALRSPPGAPTGVRIVR